MRRLLASVLSTDTFPLGVHSHDPLCENHAKLHTYNEEGALCESMRTARAPLASWKPLLRPCFRSLLSYLSYIHTLIVLTPSAAVQS